MGGEESNLSMVGPSTSERGYEEEAEAARALETDFAKEDDVSQNTGLLERLSELEREIARLAVSINFCVFLFSVTRMYLKTDINIWA